MWDDGRTVVKHQSRRLSTTKNSKPEHIPSTGSVGQKRSLIKRMQNKNTKNRLMNSFWVLKLKKYIKIPNSSICRRTNCERYSIFVLLQFHTDRPIITHFQITARSAFVTVNQRLKLCLVRNKKKKMLDMRTMIV